MEMGSLSLPSWQLFVNYSDYSEKMRNRITLAVMALALAVPSLSRADGLKESFQNPPASARPRVWWHWMNGNISKDGIRKDLQWMKRAGIGGFTVFDAGADTPQIVDHRIAYMTPEWKDALSCALHLADSLGLEATIPSSPGWSLMGGPWVGPKDGMKKVVWRSVDYVSDGKRHDIALPAPFETTGAFQNTPIVPNTLLGEVIPDDLPHYYEDTRVIAVPVLDGEKSLKDMALKVIGGGKQLDLDALTDDDLTTAVQIKPDAASGKAQVDIELREAYDISTIQISDGHIRLEFDAMPADLPWTVQTSLDGVTYSEPMIIPDGGAMLQTVSFPPVKAKYLRFMLDQPAADALSSFMGFAGPQAPKPVKLYALNVFTTTKVNHSEEKSGFMATHDIIDYPTPDAPAVKFSQVRDLSSFLRPDGSLSWKAPKGKWRIYRFGWSLTGKRNHPASPEATGLEIDKLDKSVWDRYFDTYFGMYSVPGYEAIQYILTDSYESGCSTWMAAMEEEFLSRRGYDLAPWMPALAGVVLDSAEATERFLWDWRKTISELTAECYDHLTEIARNHGLKGRYTESHEHGRLYVADGMEVKRSAAIPMAAFWAKKPDSQDHNDVSAAADIRESASVAHIYGQNLVASESFTVVGFPNNAWTFSPENLKPYADFAFSNGINRIIVHTSPHQPSDSLRPGLSLTATGQWFDRHETWAERAKGWTDYLARTSFMLQQGNFAADILYYYPEDNNISALFSHAAPMIPVGYNFDYVNADALTNVINADGGRMTSPGGTSYEVLVLDGSARKMTLPVLRKIAALADAGVKIVGKAPESVASLNDDQKEFDTLLRSVWDSGRANVFPSIQSALSATSPDVIFPDGSEKLRFVHRHTDDGEIYWISNTDGVPGSYELSFRVTGRKPLLFHAEDGSVEEVSYRMSAGRTIVSLDLAKNDAVFVVFEEQAVANELDLPRKKSEEVSCEWGAWKVALAGKTLELSELQTLTAMEDPEVKYFSGSAVYSNDFTLGEPGGKLILDLGSVKNIAVVRVNGQEFPVMWKAPFTMDISSAVKAGENRIEVEVTNLWANRLIGDTVPGTVKHSYTSMPFYYSPATPLLPSGLIGPVRILLSE